MNYAKILSCLYSLESPAIKLGLDRMQRLLDKTGNPEKNLKCIHVAGTNGKGSVCAMLNSILIEAGYKVGMYTSPHLQKFNERIRINNKLITDKEIVNYFLKIKPHITNQSFFEITTAMAFLYFYDKNVDFAVLETGLGGRLDATNVVNPQVSVITNIGLEHAELLGNAIEKIAFEKAGIIKENVPVVTGAKGNALEIIKKIAKERNAPLFLAKKFGDVEFRYLNGAFQQQNKDIALTTIHLFKKYKPVKITQNQIITGIKKTKWPARLQFVSKNILVDAAHNTDSFRVLKNELKIIKSIKNIKNFIFIIGVQKDKNIKMILKIIYPLIFTIILTKSKNPKAADPKSLSKIFDEISNKKSVKKIIIKNPKKALKYAGEIAGKKDLIVVAGSIYMLGEII